MTAPDHVARTLIKNPCQTGASTYDIATSDHHFGHVEALGLYQRPFAFVAEMDRQMIDRWNSVIGPDDEVWHLGDFAIRLRPDRVTALVKTLHGRKHLITGNNDDAAVNGCDGWENIQPYAEVSVDGVHLVLCHDARRPLCRPGGFARDVYAILNGDSNKAEAPRDLSISSSLLYLAIRSPRQADPVLIWPPPIATAKSAMKVSSVSPDRCETTKCHPAARQRSIV